ncbi:twin-arginine translocase TatA/TatE family subunit [Mucilaginibacter sp. RB4R14]|uniref:Sec-independent protein translocase subunit TatA/TatB n=1 Tax=Mucilaginibacter aurantiaciroseus TaxID=2949308 RepID=UPI0020904C4F|nr:twin-arginine translocase TatA/TatE family subunit [Mucilaginibacter aurantiaciroseus]MCO5937368.1 twin-arginine translocase TatA/TatE family subunit [Mucilaginibacter aurantiaciroseus]
MMLSSVLLFLNIGSGEMVLIVFAALLLFGGKKLPELARGLGKGIRDFKDASEDVKREINNQINNYEEKKTEKAAEIEAAAEEVKTEEAHTTTEEVPEHGYEPVAGTIPAFRGHGAPAGTEHSEGAIIKEIAEDATFEHNAEAKPASETAQSTINLTKTAEEPVKKVVEEEHK